MLFLALGGIAAAGALFFATRKSEAPAEQPQAVEVAVTPPAAPSQAATAAPTAEPVQVALAAPEPTAVAENAPAAGNDVPSTTDAAKVAGGAVAPAANGAVAVAAANADGSKSAPTKVEPSGSLDEAMKKAVGAEEKKAEATPAAESEAAPTNVPDLPPQGKVSSALSGGKSAAKGCIAGADEPSTASITFGSSGAVKSVDVSGWAAGKPAAACIKQAFQGANVGPFSKPSYRATATIRP